MIVATDIFMDNFMGLIDDVINQRDALAAQGRSGTPDDYNGVTKEKIEEVLKHIDRATNDMVEAVFALLSTEPSWFKRAASQGLQYRAGATVAHIGAHIGILQRGKSTKLDREGRDYWLKPLWEIGAIEKVYFQSSECIFVQGHPVPKSPNSAYKLADGFVKILESPDKDWKNLADEWIEKDVRRERLRLQATQSAKTSQIVTSAHSQLIEASARVYAARFLKGYEVLYIDDGDGDRITNAQANALSSAGLKIKLNDSMPDVLLWNRNLDSLWVIEAVTSDGEVDIHKKESLTNFAMQNGKVKVGFTTTYQTWKKAAERQSKLKNLANDTYLWILEDPSRNIHIMQ